MNLDDEEAIRYSQALAGMADVIESLEEVPLPQPAVRYGARGAGYTPTLEEDPYNAFVRKCSIPGSEDGPLAGLRFAVKDNTAVAGLPLTNASRTLNYVPQSDAVVVERLLEAGGTLVGKLNQDDFASGPTGETSYFGPSRNPVNPDHAAGGSSGGTGAAVRAAEVDFALGVDQGGSGRIPASFCGVVALKATHGLIPSHGTTHLDNTLDHVCPTGRSVEMVARVLDVIAGTDDRDPQWVRGVIQRDDYGDIQQADLSGMRVGIVREAVSGEVCQPAVQESFERTVKLLTDAGVATEEISIPLWDRGWDILGVLLMHLAGIGIKSEGAGYGHLAPLDVDRMHALALARRLEADQFPPLVKTWLIGERYFSERYFGLGYAQAHNVRLFLRQDLMKAAEEFSFLLTPTTPGVAPKLAVGREEEHSLMERVPDAVFNTAPLNLSGQPALVMPNGEDSTGLPTSVQLIGKHFDERSLLGVGLALEGLLQA